MVHECEESREAERKKWNPMIDELLGGSIADFLGPMHYLHTYELGGETIERCIHCGEMWTYT